MNNGVASLIELLRKVSGVGGSHFRYKTYEEFIDFPRILVPITEQENYDAEIKRLLDSALQGNDYWTVWAIWKKHQVHRLRIDTFFKDRIASTESFKQLEGVLIFLSADNLEYAYTRLREVVTVQVMVQSTAHEWRRLEYVLKRPDREDPSYLTEVFEWGQELFKQSVASLSESKYQSMKLGLSCPFSLKLGGTDLSKFFRN